MTFWRQLGFSDASAGVLAVLALVFGGGAWLIQRGSAPEPVPAVQVAEPVVQDATVVGVEPAKPSDDAVVEAEPIAEAEVEPEPPLVSAPKLDLVRVSPDGDAVIAGIADPDAVVVFLVNGIEVARATADAGGNFVGLFDIPASDKPNSITVASERADGTLISDESVLIAAIAEPVIEEQIAEEKVAQAETVQNDPVIIPETMQEENVVAKVEADTKEPEPDAGEAPMAVVTEPVSQPPADTVVVSVENEQDVVSSGTTSQQQSEPSSKVVIEQTEEPEQAADQVATTEPAPEALALDETPVQVQDSVTSIAPATVEPAPALNADKTEKTAPRDAPTIVVANSSGVKVLQPAQQPKAPTAASTANVVIDTITYDSAGEVALLGRGSGDGFVRIYLNDKPILTVPVDPDGSWSTPLADVDAGVYRLRIDEIAADGNVTSRVETPFQREEVEIAADAPPTAVTVQPGSTLWAIAQDRFGEGIEYVRVYEANRDLIRDPDLIYPGQVFALPTD